MAREVEEEEEEEEGEEEVRLLLLLEDHLPQLRRELLLHLLVLGLEIRGLIKLE